MALKGKTPTVHNKRLKALFYGPAGVGKTTAAIQFPKPYIIDTERGAENEQYVSAIKKAGGAYMFSTDADEVIAEVTALLSEKHEYQTVIIDPLTVLYNGMLDSAAEKVGTEFGRYKIEPDRKIKRLTTLLTRLDMNVIITSHAKPNWVRTKDAKGKDTAVQEGVTFDCYGRLDYIFDLVFEIAKRGKDRVGVVKKTRIGSFPEGEVFPFSYEEVATRYGREHLERDAVAVALATPDQVQQLTELLKTRVDGEALKDKWLSKAEADNLNELASETAAKCIDFLSKPQAAKDIK